MSNQPLNDQERKTLAAYPVLGYRILKSFSVSENIALGVLEQQERYDGSGYPRGLLGENISVYARVIGVASSYSAIVSNRPYRKASDGHAGIMDLLRTNRSAYDEKVLKALVYCLSVFPVGTYVLLNNGAKAVVHRSNPKDPRCPTVRMLTDKDGKALQDRPLIATSQEKGIMIARSLNAGEIAAVARK
jgi:HD-GYP domain-containing protein (c-di-GMP phosphodiesterase class II)